MPEPAEGTAASSNRWLQGPGPEDTERARRGEAPAIVRPGSGGEHVRAFVLANARPEFVWRAVTDYDHLAEFVPGVRESRLAGELEERKRVEQVGEAGALGLNLAVRVVLEVQEYPQTRVDFRAVEGDFRRLEGTWLLTPLDGGERCILSYGAVMKPRFFAPGFVLRRSLSEDVPRQLRALAARAERLKRAV